MSPSSHNFKPVGHEIENLVEDEDGNLVESYRTEETLESQADGSPRLVKRSTSKAGPDGLVWNPAMAKEYPPGICRHCRRPPWRFPWRPRPRKGRLTMQKAVHCAGCGILLCPRCRVEAEDQHRCIPCHRYHRLKTVLGRLFWS